MSDEFYFACLAVTLASAILCPVYCRRVFKDQSPASAVIAALAVTAGIACAAPFAGTREMPWFALLAWVYFGSAALGSIFYGLARPRAAAPKETPPAETATDNT